jgi:hypothetical protein
MLQYKTRPRRHKKQETTPRPTQLASGPCSRGDRRAGISRPVEISRDTKSEDVTPPPGTLRAPYYLGAQAAAPSAGRVDALDGNTGPTRI